MTTKLSITKIDDKNIRLVYNGDNKNVDFESAAVYFAEKSSKDNITIWPLYNKRETYTANVSETEINGVPASQMDDPVAELNSFIGNFKSGGSSSETTTIVTADTDTIKLKGDGTEDSPLISEITDEVARVYEIAEIGNFSDVKVGDSLVGKTLVFDTSVTTANTGWGEIWIGTDSGYTFTYSQRENNELISFSLSYNEPEWEAVFYNYTDGWKMESYDLPSDIGAIDRIEINPNLPADKPIFDNTKIQSVTVVDPEYNYKEIQTLKEVATTTSDGLMAAEDKAKLDELTPLPTSAVDGSSLYYRAGVGIRWMPPMTQAILNLEPGDGTPRTISGQLLKANLATKVTNTTDQQDGDLNINYGNNITLHSEFNTEITAEGSLALTSNTQSPMWLSSGGDMSLTYGFNGDPANFYIKPGGDESGVTIQTSGETYDLNLNTLNGSIAKYNGNEIAVKVDATTTESGLMSAVDKAKTDRIGIVCTGLSAFTYSETAPKVNVNLLNTNTGSIYSAGIDINAATATTAGAMTAADKTKLDNLVGVPTAGSADYFFRYNNLGNPQWVAPMSQADINTGTNPTSRTISATLLKDNFVAISNEIVLSQSEFDALSEVDTTKTYYIYAG